MFLGTRSNTHTVSSLNLPFLNMSYFIEAAEWYIKSRKVRTLDRLLGCLKKDIEVAALLGGEKGDKAQEYWNDINVSNIYICVCVCILSLNIMFFFVFFL